MRWRRPRPRLRGWLASRTWAIRVSNVDSEVSFFGKMGFEQAFANTKDGKTTEAYVKINKNDWHVRLRLMPTGAPQRPAGFADAGFESGDLNALNARYAADRTQASTEVRKGGASRS